MRTRLETESHILSPRAGFWKPRPKPGIGPARGAAEGGSREPAAGAPDPPRTPAVRRAQADPQSPRLPVVPAWSPGAGTAAQRPALASPSSVGSGPVAARRLSRFHHRPSGARHSQSGPPCGAPPGRQPPSPHARAAPATFPALRRPPGSAVTGRRRRARGGVVLLVRPGAPGGSDWERAQRRAASPRRRPPSHRTPTRAGVTAPLRKERWRRSAGLVGDEGDSLAVPGFRPQLFSSAFFFFNL